MYVADLGTGKGDIYGPAVILPDVTTGTPSAVARDSAVLQGHLDPAGGEAVSSCKFEYGIDNSYSGGSVPCSPGPPYTTPTNVTAKSSNLQSATIYHYRLVAGNGKGTNAGGDETFTTDEAVTDLSTAPATQITDTGAELNGSYTGDGNDTHYYFEYGENASYGQNTSPPPGLDAQSWHRPTDSQSGGT